MKHILTALLLILPWLGFGQVLESSTLPIIKISTNGNTIVDEPKVLADMEIIDNGEGNLNRPTDTPNDYDGVIGIEFRGSSSQALFAKKNYGIELRKVGEQDTSVALLGMPAEEDWVLHGPYSDKTLMRNALTFHLWNATDRYGSRTRYVELILDSDYKGVYILMEKIKRDGDRVDIAKLEEDENSGDDLTGGYIIKLDKFDGGNSGEGFVSSYAPPLQTSQDQRIYFQYDYPKGDNITPQQEAYIQDYVREFEDALYGGDFLNPVTGYKAFAEMESFVDFAIMNEVSRNVDGYRLSTFMYKDKDSKGGKLTLGPIWDFNLAWGNANYCDGSNTTGWAWDFNQVCDQDFWLIPFWWDRLLQDPEFVETLNTRWTELRAGRFSTASIHNYIDSLALAMDDPIIRNYERWPIIGEYIWPNNYVGSSYQDEINYLKDWVSQRMIWLDNSIPTLRTITSNEEITERLLRVYPNPVGSRFTLASPVQIRKYSVGDLQGREIINSEGSGQLNHVVDTSTLPGGVYILSVEYIDGGKESIRLLK